MAPSLRGTLPEIYSALLPELFDREAIEETRATCNDCAMCDKSGADAAAVSSFLPDAKCCTYHPTLPNYLVGALLADPSSALEEGRRRVRARIASRIGVTPQWLDAPRKERVLFNASRLTSFGRNHELLCPYFARESGNCTIWKHREAVCATFFCKYDAGAVGYAFWIALRHWLAHVERVLASWAVKSIAPEATEPEVSPGTMTLHDLQGRPPPDAEYRSMWGGFAGREEELYIACAERVRALPREEAAAMMDAGAGRELRETLASRYESLIAPKLADRLVLNPERRVLPLVNAVGVTTYSRYDSLVLAQRLYDALAHLVPDEPPLDTLRRELGDDASEDLLLQLQLHEVVVSPPRDDRG
jgi:hypothetical protein